MKPIDKPPCYHAYMLRMWQERHEDNRPDPAHHVGSWRFQLEDPHTGRRLGFSDLAALSAYLQTEIVKRET